MRAAGASRVGPASFAAAAVMVGFVASVIAVGDRRLRALSGRSSVIDDWLACAGRAWRPCVRHDEAARAPRQHAQSLLMVVALLVISIPCAQAQSFDYGGFEQMFGEPVTMSVTGKPQRASDAPANVEIITQDDIRRSGATSIPDVLQFVAGIDLRRDGIASADVGIRGYNQTANPHLMVLVDGRQVYMVDYGRVIWAAIPVQLNEIRQIEIIKGPNSALYGFNAVGGVINIITFDPLHDRVNVAETQFGTQQYRGGSAVGTLQLADAFGLRLSAGGFSAQDFAPGPLASDDRLARLPPYGGTFAADGRWMAAPGVELFARAGLGQTRLAEQEPPGLFGSERLINDSVQLGIDADTALGALTLSATHSDVQVDLLGATFGQLIGQGEYQTTTVLQASDLAKIGTDHALRVALELRDYADNSGTLAAGTISNQIAAASAMWDWQVTPRITLTNAVRLDTMWLHYQGTLPPGSGLTEAQYNHATLTQPSLNSGVVWRATDNDTLRLSLARGVQLPTLLQYAIDERLNSLPPRLFLGSPSLDPAIVWNVELDYDRNLAPIHSTLRTALFAQTTQDVLAWPFGTPVAGTLRGVPVLFSRNVGSTQAAGGELELQGHAASGFRWQASYAFAATADHTILNRGAVPTSIVEYAESTPQHVLIGGFGYTHARWEAELLARWQSRYLDYRANAARTALLPIEIDNYVTMTARVAYRLTDRVTLALTAQQLNQAQLVETAGPPIERRIIASLTVRL